METVCLCEESLQKDTVCMCVCMHLHVHESLLLTHKTAVLIQNQKLNGDQSQSSCTGSRKPRRDLEIPAQCAVEFLRINVFTYTQIK